MGTLARNQLITAFIIWIFIDIRANLNVICGRLLFTGTDTTQAFDVIENYIKTHESFHDLKYTEIVEV